MDLKQLRYFAAVVEQGSVSAAARALYMSQPPLSTQIRQLEEELGCQLFDRDGRRLSPTDAGKLLFERAKGLLEMADSMEKELRDFENGVRGTLRLGAVSSICSADLPGWLSAFRRKNPEVRLEISEQNTYQLLEQLRSRRLDLALIRTPFPADGLSFRALREERMMAVGKKETFACFFATLPEMLTIAALQSLPLIIYRRWEQPLSGLMRRAGLKPDYLCVCDDARTVAALADAGLGIGIVPDSSAGFSDYAVEITDPAFRSSIVAAVCRDAYLSPVARSFLESLGAVGSKERTEQRESASEEGIFSAN